MGEPLNLFEIELLAQPRVERTAWDYVAGGADDEITLRENRAAFERIRLRPRYLVDVSRRDLSTTVLGNRIPFPLLLAPTAHHGLCHPEGEVETVRGAAAAGAPLIVSTLATRPMEEIAAAAGDLLLWYQLYMMADMEVNEWLVRRAERAGYRALVFTVDLPVAGNRERDRRNNFDLPPGVKIGNLYAEREADAPAAVRKARQNSEVDWKLDLSWRDVEWLRRTTQLPIIIKGLLSAEDARLAVEHGAAGVLVSNHGGRQLDGAPAAIDALPEVVAVVGDQIEVYLDGGVRRGVDIVKALALGARAVCIGRPYLWGLAWRGAAGVQRVIELLRAEFDTALALVGKTSPSELDESVIWGKISHIRP